jgi:hypothetical protein
MASAAISSALKRSILRGWEPTAVIRESSHLQHEPKPSDRVKVKYFDDNTPPFPGALESRYKLSIRIESPTLGLTIVHMPWTAGRALSVSY